MVDVSDVVVASLAVPVAAAIPVVLERIPGSPAVELGRPADSGLRSVRRSRTSAPIGSAAGCAANRNRLWRRRNMSIAGCSTASSVRPRPSPW